MFVIPGTRGMFGLGRARLKEIRESGFKKENRLTPHNRDVEKMSKQGRSEGH